jgi:alpha-beta hydrolase superfamily lysophospholipase
MANGDRLQLWYPVDNPAVQGLAPYTYHLRQWLTKAEATSPALTDMPDAVQTDSYLNAPMATDTAASGNPNDAFPIVLFSHGSASYPEQSSFLTEHLAQWGFVVAAPDHRSRDLASVLADSTNSPTASSDTAPVVVDSDIDDLDNTLAYLRQQNATPNAFFHHHLDFSKVGVLGHSSGGGTAVTMADKPVVRTYVALAPAPGTPPSAHKPGLVMDGSADKVLSPSAVLQLYASLPTPKRLIVIKGTGHNVFDDVCTVASDGKRLTDFLAHITDAGEGLSGWATNVPDGCHRPDVFPTTARPLIDQATTAQMRSGLGIDHHPVGLGPGLDDAYPGLSSTYSQKL